MPTIDQILSEAQAGLNNEQGRLGDALEVATYVTGERDLGKVLRGHPQYEEIDLFRQSQICHWLAATLSKYPYNQAIARTLHEAPAATEALTAAYRSSNIDAILQAADYWSTLQQVAAIQVEPTPDPAAPVRHRLWPASNFVVWESDEHPLDVVAVGTIDRFDQQSRLRIYTADAVHTLLTDRLTPGQTSGGRTYRLAGPPEPHPYGVIPFAFLHHRYPTTQFWSGGPGAHFAQLNNYLDHNLTGLGDSIRYSIRPFLTASGVAAEWNPKRRLRPGEILSVVESARDAGGVGPEARLAFLQPDTAYVGDFWADMAAYLDQMLQEADVPPAAFRLVQDSARSGAAIVAEQLPLLDRARGRQRLYERTEQQLAAVTLAVLAAHLGANGRPAPELAAAASIPLTVRWPVLGARITDPQRNQEDAWRLQTGLVSRRRLLVERYGYTLEEADAYLGEVAAELKAEAALGLAAVADPSTVTDESE